MGGGTDGKLTRSQGMFGFKTVARLSESCSPGGHDSESRATEKHPATCLVCRPSTHPKADCCSSGQKKKGRRCPKNLLDTMTESATISPLWLSPLPLETGGSHVVYGSSNDTWSDRDRLLLWTRVDSYARRYGDLGMDRETVDWKWDAGKSLRRRGRRHLLELALCG